jgi:hypothetical protein
MVLNLYLQYWISSAILAAANLGIADAVGDEPRDVESIAKAIGADPRCLLRLLRGLAAVGVFREQPTRHFVHTPRSIALRSEHPANERALIRMFGMKSTRQAMVEYENAIRTGRSGYEIALGAASPFDIMATRPDEAAVYHDGMSVDSELTTQILGKCDFTSMRTIVDVGGGRGTLLGRLLAAYPDKRGILFDLPEVVANAVFAQPDVAERCEVRAGDLRVEIPAGGDCYVLKNIMHGRPDDDCVALLARIRNSAAPKAGVFIIENVLSNDSRLDFAKIFDLFLLLGGNQTRVRCEDEFRNIVVRSGLAFVGVQPIVQSQCIIAAKLS